MARIIATYPRIALTSRGDAFTTLARSIVGQQISVKAAAAVWGRFCGTCGEVSPKSVLRRRATTLRACGLSERKVEYIRDLCQHFVSGRVEPTRFAEQDDEAIIAELTDIRGIGRWTAEMFLIFHELRADVFPVGDIGLQKAIATDGTEPRRPRSLVRRLQRREAESEMRDGTKVAGALLRSELYRRRDAPGRPAEAARNRAPARGSGSKGARASPQRGGSGAASSTSTALALLALLDLLAR